MKKEFGVFFFHKVTKFRLTILTPLWCLGVCHSGLWSSERRRSLQLRNRRGGPWGGSILLGDTTTKQRLCYTFHRKYYGTYGTYSRFIHLIMVYMDFPYLGEFMLLKHDSIIHDISIIQAKQSRFLMHCSIPMVLVQKSSSHLPGM